MSAADLREEVELEFEAIEKTLAETDALDRDMAGREPTPRELAAAGLFLANVYNGIENILERIRLFHGLALPSGPNWSL